MTLEETRERETVALKNAQALGRLMRDYSLYIPAHDFPNWRPTASSSGNIPGVASNVTIIATNGLLAYFVFDDPSVPVLCGHIQCFTGEVKTLYATEKRRSQESGENKERKKRKKKSESVLEQAMAALRGRLTEVEKT